VPAINIRGKPIEVARATLGFFGHRRPSSREDHFQVNVEKYAANRDGLGLGFYNIDVDTSTLVDLSHDTQAEQQRLNYEAGASTRPDEAFNRFADCDAAEVHLATGFQNIQWDGGFPFLVNTEECGRIQWSAVPRS